MANRISIQGVDITNAEILDCKIMRQKSPFSDPLAFDTVEATIDLAAVDNYLMDDDEEILLDANNEILFAAVDIDFKHYRKGEPCDIYHNDEYLGRYYIANVVRRPKEKWLITLYSALGMLNKIPFDGDVYERVTAGEIINSIMGGEYVSEEGDLEFYEGRFSYYLDKTLKNTLVSGWIPALNSSRDALQTVLFAIGGSVLKESDGLMKFAFWQPTSVVDLTETARFYEGGDIDIQAKKTKIVVTEHEFRITQYDKQVELYDSQGLTVEHKRITFDNPCHNLASDTLTIEKSGANFAIVSGVGVLTGFEYTHNTTTIEKLTGVEGEEDVASVTNNYLVSSLNSLNVAERDAAYYGGADFVNYEFVANGDVEIGDRVSFVDPFGETIDGYLMSEDITMSGILKAEAQFITNWKPNHQGNAFNRYTIIDSGTTWNVPEELIGKPARFVVFGGFEGGSGGEDGNDGTQAFWDIPFGYGGSGGAGGEGGEAGYRVNILTLDVPALASSYNFTLGEGGNGGAKQQAGQLGTDSVFSGLSTSLGVQNIDGWANPIDGTIYNDATIATKGIRGANGGNGHGLTFYAGGGVVYGDGTKGGDVGDHKGGEGSKNVGGYRTGGGGGGASADMDGFNGTESTGTYYGGNGGNGADAIEKPQAQLGQCGKGANGGGGGGGSGIAGQGYDDSSFYPWYAGNVGRGGKTSRGQKGSDGFIVVMHE